MSDTPRTNAESGYFDGSGCWRHRDDGECVRTEFAAQLERELAASQSLCTDLVSELDQLRVAELLKDKARLDWLESQGKWFNPRRHVDGYEPISREVIDAARK